MRISFYYTYRFGAFRGERPPFFGGEKYLLKLILPMRETLSHTVLLYVFFIFSNSCDTQEAKAFCYTDTHFILFNLSARYWSRKVPFTFCRPQEAELKVGSLKRGWAAFASFTEEHCIMPRFLCCGCGSLL